MDNQPVMGNKDFIIALYDLPEIHEYDDPILALPDINNKGHRKRLKNACQEAIAKKHKKLTNCSKCGGSGHNSRTCDKYK